MGCCKSTKNNPQSTTPKTNETIVEEKVTVLTSNKTNSQSTSSKPNETKKEVKDALDEKDTSELLSRRPKRNGAWFIVSLDTLKNKVRKYIDKINIYEEFFKGHPNCRDGVEDFVAIKLSPEQIKVQREVIRVSSYRWQNVKGLGRDGNAFSIPSNYSWFLKSIRENGFIGWIDFVANIGVNCPVPETLEYMGNLYATSFVLGDWFQSIQKLKVAMTRGWIFQESAFGELDADAALVFIKFLRQLGLNLQHGSNGAVKEYISALTVVSEFLNRRGYSRNAEESEVLDSIKWSDQQYLARILSQDTGCSYDAVMEALDDHWDDIYSDMHFFHPAIIFATTNEYMYKRYENDFFGLFITSHHLSLKTVDEFFDVYGESILYAAMETELTYEEDRPTAITQVAQGILQRLGGKHSSAIEVIDSAWQNLQRRMASGEYTTIASNFFEAHAEPNRNVFPFGSAKMSGAVCDFQGSYAVYLKNGGGEAKVHLNGLYTHLMGIEWKNGKLIHEETDTEVKLCLCTHEQFDLRMIIAIADKGPVMIKGLTAGTRSYLDFDLPARNINFWSRKESSMK